MKTLGLAISLILLFTFQTKRNESQNQAKFEFMVLAIDSDKMTVLDPAKNSPPPNRYGSDQGFKQTIYLEAIEQEFVLDKFGRDGWQLVSIVGILGGDKFYYFQRLLPQK